MLRFAPAALVLMPLLAACGGGAGQATQSETGGLATACAIVECECIGSSVGTFTLEDPMPVTWTAKGQATCEPGWRLRRVN